MGVIFSSMLSSKKERMAGPGRSREWEADKMRRRWIREQRTLCGDRYMEVDFLWVSDQQHRSSSRGKKALASSLAQAKRNANRAGRYFIQILNVNFDERGLHITLTYNDAFAPEDEERAERDLANYMRRVKRWIRRNGMSPAALRWISVTEGQGEDKAAGQKAVRWHHHLILQMDGLDKHQREQLRSALEDLWAVRIGGVLESLGTVNADRLQPGKDGLQALGLYLLKYPKRKKRWHQSQGLRKPKYPRPNDTRWTAHKLAAACTMEVDDAAAWERRFPGWRFLGAHPCWSEERGEWRLYIRFYKLPERPVSAIRRKRQETASPPVVRAGIFKSL